MNWAETLITKNKMRPLEKKRIIAYFTFGAQAIYMPLDDLPSFLIGGMPKHGKTSAMVFYACQIVMAGGQLLVIDPHASAPRDSLASAVTPLAPWFALPTLDFTEVESSVIVSYFQFVLDEYEARKKPNGTLGKQPFYLMVDEWNELLDSLDDDELKTVLFVVRTVARGGRKYGMHVALAAQQWQLAATGGSSIRKNVQGRISFNAELADIRMILDTRDTHTLKNLCLPPLDKGHAIMKVPGSGMGMQRVRFPFTDRRACELTAAFMNKYTGECEYAAPARIVLHDTPNTITLREYPTRTQPALQQTEGGGVLHPSPAPSQIPILGQKEVNVNVNTVNVNVKEATIRAAALTQLRLTGIINRTKLRDDLGLNNRDYPLIKRICDEIPLPPRDTFTEEEWQELKARYNHTCLKCHRQEPEIILTKDHIVPSIKGGANTIENIQPLCLSCNSSKQMHVIDYRPKLEES